MALSKDLVARRQRLKVAIRAIEKTRTNAMTSSEETVEEAALASALAAVLSVADLIPGMAGIDGKLGLKPRSDQTRRGHRLAEEVVTGKLETKRQKLKDIETGVDKSDAFDRKIGKSKKDMTDAAAKLKHKKDGDPVKEGLVTIAELGAEMVGIAESIGGAAGRAASKARDAAIVRFLTDLLRLVRSIDTTLTKVAAEAHRKGN